jgi:serine/threonine protein kinase
MGINISNSRERTVKIDFDKCNTFRLGMMLLECLSLTNPITVAYNPSMTKINFNAIKNLINNKIVPSYTEEFVSFLRILISPNPQDRPTLMEVQEIYSKFMSTDYELRVCGKSPNE